MATLFALLLAGGVLLGVMAIAVDVGQIYAERTELQNGADSAALAMARACSTDAADCDDLSGLVHLAQTYADNNASDGTSNVLEVCGRAGDVLPACSDQPTNLTACLGDPPLSDYVEVRVGTRLSDGSLVLPPTFAQAMASDFDGVTVGACARATWVPDDLTILAMTISECEFGDDTEDGFGDADAPSAADEHVIQFWEDAHERCPLPGPEAPWQRPGEAGFLDGGGSDCSIAVTADGVVTGDFIRFIPFALAPASCENRVRQAMLNHEVVYLPVHNGRSGSDADPQFRQVFVAPFLVTGFQLAAPVDSTNPPYQADDHRLRSYLTGDHPCNQNYHRCISGLFVGDPIPIADLVADSRVRLIG